MLKSQLLASILLATAVGTFAQSQSAGAGAVPGRNEQDEKAIRALLAIAFEESWNSHQPAKAVTPDKCVDDAIFISNATDSATFINRGTITAGEDALDVFSLGTFENHGTMIGGEPSRPGFMFT